MSVVLMTGASGGIGYIAAERLAALGHKVYGAARRVGMIEPLREKGVMPVMMDLTDPESVRKGISMIIEKEGAVDILVNNAGYGEFGPMECVSVEDARKQMDVNLFGMAELTRAVIPGMRSKGAGRIINISSVAGRGCIYFGGWYNISKYAVEAFSDALRTELKPFGICVSIIEPGPIRTAWGTIAADNLEKSAEGTVYQEVAHNEARNLRNSYSPGRFFPGPEKVAAGIVRAATSRRPRVRYHIGFGSRSFIFFHTLLPARWWDALVRLLGKKIL